MSRRAIKLISIMGKAAMEPYRIPGGHWGSPKVSARWAAEIRKKAIVDGTFGSFSYPKGGWDPEWDKFKKPLIRRPYKGHKNERTRDDRFNAITRKLADQPQLIEKHREAIAAAKPKPGIQTLYKRLLSMKGGSK